MKKHKKFNRTKTIVLLIIVLLGLYVVSTKSVPLDVRGNITATTQRTITDLHNQINALKAQWQTTISPTIRAQLAARIAALETQLQNLRASLQRPVVRPMS